MGAGLALTAKRYDKHWRSYVVLSDGEMDGSNWEAALFAAHHGREPCGHHRLQQASGLWHDAQCIEPGPPCGQMDIIRYHAVEIDGNDVEALGNTLTKFDTSDDVPKVIVAHTLKGKGVSFMENKLEWHYKDPKSGSTEKSAGGTWRDGMRDAFTEALSEAAARDHRIWLITGDLGFNVLEGFAERFPDRYLVRSGGTEYDWRCCWHRHGRKHSLCVFAGDPIVRCLEQIRNDVCYAPRAHCRLGMGLSIGRRPSNHEIDARHAGDRAWGPSSTGGDTSMTQSV